MDMCLLCLELKNETSDGIKVTSEQWKDQDMDKIIEKHFWVIKSITPNSWLCKNCWEIVNDFHKFHTRIEEAHAYFVNMLKTELQEANEDMGMTILKSDLTGDETSCGQDRYTECLNNNTKEDESQSLEIKEEVEIIEEQLIHVDVQISMKRKSKNKDPLQKPLPGKSRKLRKSFKSVQAAAPESANNKETLEDDETEISIENTTNQNEDSSHSPTDFVDDCNRLSSSSESESEDQNQTGKTSNEWKPRPNPYYKPCTKRKETDEFLAKHFKIICAICQSSMHTFHELTKHFSKQHNEPAYAVCCNRKFLKCSLLVDHIHCHLDPDYFKCKHCGKLMSDRRCLELHAKTHGIQDKTHICDICQKGFSRKIGLRNHKLIHLSDEEKKFACDQCGKLFGNNNLLANHVRVVHLNKYALVCDICGEKMRGKDVFERHMLKHKGVDVPTIACDVCGLKVTGQRGLKRHKDSQHPEGGKRDFPCHMCSHISPTLKAFKKHVKDKHELGYDFKCTLCEKAFKRASSLKEHMASHTGTTLYSCSYCPKTFNSNANMHSHRKKAHPKEWEEECRAKYSGNLPEKYKIKKTTTTTTNEVQNDSATISKWY